MRTRHRLDNLGRRISGVSDGGSAAPASAMLWPDGTVMLWPDGTVMLWPS